MASARPTGVLSDLVTDPDEFFARETTEHGLLKPTLVVTVLAVVSVLAGLPLAQATVRALPAEMEAFAGIGYVSVIVGGFVGPFLVWLLYTTAFYLVSRFAFDGGGSFGRTLQVTAWGLAPAIVAAFISGITWFYVLQTATFPRDPTQVFAFTVRLRNDPLVLASGIVGVFILLWQAFIWTFGVKHAQDVPLRDAAITVAVPVGIAILWRVYGLA